MWTLTPLDATLHRLTPGVPGDASGRDAVAAALAALPMDARVLTNDRPENADARALLAASGLVVRESKAYVGRELDDLSDLVNVPPGWRFRSYAEAGAPAFAAALLAASEGDPFHTSTPETAEGDLAGLVEAAGDAFDPTEWLLVADEQGPVGAALPQPYPDVAGLGSVFHLGVHPGRRGAGLGAALHALGLRALRRRGVTTYVGSTDIRNAPMLAVFRRNGCALRHHQLFYGRAS